MINIWKFLLGIRLGQWELQWWVFMKDPAEPRFSLLKSLVSTIFMRFSLKIIFLDILNDETQRKYLQALKRLITLAQKLYPNDDPTKCIWT
jgi:succinate dehydrogenase hydrophobic anchor subunit